MKQIFDLSYNLHGNNQTYTTDITETMNWPTVYKYRVLETHTIVNTLKHTQENRKPICYKLCHCDSYFYH